MTERFEGSTIGDIVAADFRTASVFEQFGIDFCCGGRRSLEDACRAASADTSAVIQALVALPTDGVDDEDVSRGPLDRLIEHITATHHAYVRSALPAISSYLARLREAHGASHPELTRIAMVWHDVSRDLQQHMVKEEHVLFPYVRDLVEHAEQDCGMLQSPFGTVKNPIRMMEQEHREAADELRIIHELTDGFTAPADGCTTYAVCMAELRRFERDLHRHVHLENNVLFPRAIELENAATTSATV